MSEQLYRKLLIIVAAVGLLICIAFTAYTVREYLNCSIIAFIANEWWPR